MADWNHERTNPSLARPGTVVIDIATDSLAKQAEITVGTRIMAVQDKEVSTPAQFHDHVDQLEGNVQLQAVSSAGDVLLFDVGTD